jgi:hypothetical protein
MLYDYILKAKRSIRAYMITEKSIMRCNNLEKVSRGYADLKIYLAIL